MFALKSRTYCGAGLRTIGRKIGIAEHVSIDIALATGRHVELAEAAWRQALR
jgi:hypothetical protein